MKNKAKSEELTITASQSFKERKYWSKKLSGQLVKSSFPYDHGAAGMVEPHMDALKFEFPAAISQLLIKVSNESDRRLFMILAAGLVLLLEKYTGNRDIIIGMPVERQEIEGTFINTVVCLRNQPEENITFKELLIQVRTTIIEAIKNQNYPVETLLYDLGLEPDENEFPLFNAAVLLNNIHEKKYIRHIPLNVLFLFSRTGNSVKGCVEYNSSLYGRRMIKRITRHFTQLFKKILSNAGLQVDNIDILSAEERKQLLFDFNNRKTRAADDTASLDHKDKTIHALFELEAAKNPDTIAVVCEDVQLSYKKLNEISNHAAHTLRAKSVEPDTIVGIITGRSIGMIAGLIGILKSGGAYLPIDPGYPEERIKYIIEDSAIKLILTDKNRLPDMAGEFKGEFISLDMDKNYTKEPSNPDSTGNTNNCAYVIYTSGSTGKPKGVVIEHKSIVNTLLWRKNYYQFDQKDIVLQIPSYTFDSSVEDIFTPLVSSSRLVLLKEENSFALEYLAKIIKKSSASHFLIVPYLYKILLEEIPGCLNELKKITIAGEHFAGSLVKEHFDKLKHVELYNEYGPTENSVCTTVYQFTPERTGVLIGHPIDNINCIILDKRLHLAPIGVTGQLCVSGEGLARGYFERPELTAEKFTANPFEPGKRMYRTGDLVRWLEDGNIEFLGRIDNQVKIRGYRIEPGEIESILSGYEGIKETVVQVIKDENGDKLLCAYIVLTKGEKGNQMSPLLSGLREYLSQFLPPYMAPSLFMQIERIPLTPNGKIDRKALPQPEIVSGRKYAAPRDEIEEKLVEIWSEVLSGSRGVIGIDDNFFELGGHSLKAVTLFSKIHKELNIKILLAEFFKAPTIRGLSGYIKKAAEVKYASIELVEKMDYYALSSAQKRLYILWRMALEGTSYNIPVIIPLAEKPDLKKFEGAAIQLIERHESLRTSFHMVDDKPVQRIHNCHDIKFKIEYYHTKIPRSSYQSIYHHFDTAFNLNKAPILKVGVAKIAEEKYALVVVMHHIISDGVSQGILARDFMAFYKGDSFPPLRIQYKDFSQWQNNLLASGKIKTQEKYWLMQFEAGIPVLNLPTDYSRPAVQSFEGDAINFEIPADYTGALKTLALEEGNTLYMLLLALINILFSKLSGQEDIIIGSPIAGRRHADLGKIMGMFVNTLALRNYPNRDKTFIQFLNELGTRTLEAFENQEYQFEDLVEKVDLNRDVSRNPLFDVMFVLQNIDRTDLEIPGLKLKSYEYENIDQTSKFDIMFSGVDTGSLLRFTFQYCTKIFKKETIERFTGYFNRLVSHVLEDPHQKISQLEIMSEEEKRRVLFDFNTGVVEYQYPANKTIHRLFEQQVEKTPDNIAVHGTVREMPQQMTYLELNKKANQLAHLLIKKGTKPGTIIGLMPKRSIEIVIGILGILKSGGAYMPIDPDYPRERIDYILRDSKTRILLSEVSELSGISGETEVIDLHSLTAAEQDTKATHPIHPSHLCCVLYTSGTTGRPKGVMMNHHSLVNLVIYHYRYTNLDPSRVVQFASICFDVSFQEIFFTLLAGGVLYIPDTEIKTDIPGLCTALKKNKIKTLFLPISFIKIIFSQPDYAAQFPGDIGHIVSAGEQLVVIDRFKKYLRENNVYLHNHYGPTESHVVTTLILEPGGQIPERPSIGAPISNTRIFILDHSMHPQPVGIAGELYIGGTALARGYLNKPELTAEKFCLRLFSSPATLHPSPLYKTGDLARWLPDGKIEFSGRLDHQVKIRGFRIELGEIENQLLKHKALKEVLVMAREKEQKEKYICAYVVPGLEGAPNVVPSSELREYLSQTLPDYMIPSYFVYLDKLPLTPTGKIYRKALPEPELKAGQGHIAPGNEAEKKLAEIWAEILGIKIDTVGINSNFFELGGHSLKAVMLVLQIQKRLDATVPLVEVFKAPTVSQLAQYIKNENRKIISTKDHQLVLLKKNPGKVNHLFFIHDGSGGVEGYVEFCDRLTIEANCWGIRANNLNKYTPANLSIQNIAKDYIDKIKTVQNYGPYYIGGWSLGGTIAFEIALQLEEMGEKIIFLGLIDAPGPQENWTGEATQFSLESEIDWIRQYLPDNEIKEKIREAASINEIWPMIADYLEENSFSVEVVKRFIPDDLARAIPGYEQQDTRKLIYHLNIHRSLDKARTLYLPSGKIHTTLHYFKAGQSPRIFQDSWQDYCLKPIKSYEIPGDHFSIMKKPNVNRISRIFDNISKSL